MGTFGQLGRLNYLGGQNNKLGGQLPTQLTSYLPPCQQIPHCLSHEAKLHFVYTMGCPVCGSVQLIIHQTHQWHGPWVLDPPTLRYCHTTLRSRRQLTSLFLRLSAFLKSGKETSQLRRDRQS